MKLTPPAAGVVSVRFTEDGARYNQDITVEGGHCYYRFANLGASPGNYHTAQILNPAGSGKIMLLDWFALSSPSTCSFYCDRHNAALANDAGTPKLKLSAGAASAAQVRYTTAGAPVLSSGWQFQLSATNNLEKYLGFPIWLDEGEGFALSCQTVNVGIGAMFEWREYLP